MKQQHFDVDPTRLKGTPDIVSNGIRHGICPPPKDNRLFGGVSLELVYQNAVHE